MYADYQTLKLEREGNVGLFTLNRPEKLNAMNGIMMDEMPRAIAELATDPDVRCIVMTGAGRAFCAGGDLGDMQPGAGVAIGDGRAFSLLDAATGLYERMGISKLLHEVTKPTIAMVNGHAVGAGLSMALACDMRIAGEGAKFSTAFAKVGFSGDFGGTYFLTKLVGPAKARELFFLADQFDSDTALRLGVVNRVVADEALRAETLAVAARLAAGPTLAYGYMKQNLNDALDHDFDTCLRREAERMTITGRTEDFREASRAFLEKRTPTFKGR